MPAYNEEENIESVVKQWYPILEGKSENSRLVVADSGSTDHTHEILLKLKTEKYPRLEILATTNQYHGPKVIDLYDYALPNIMMTTYFTYYKEQICFKEISFKPRTAGANSINIPRIIKIGWKALGEFYNLKKEMR